MTRAQMIDEAVLEVCIQQWDGGLSTPATRLLSYARKDWFGCDELCRGWPRTVERIRVEFRRICDEQTVKSVISDDIVQRFQLRCDEIAAASKTAHSWK